MNKKQTERARTGNPSRRRFFLAALVSGSLALFFLAGACAGGDFALKSGYTPGIYEGSGRGYRGPLRVRVQVSSAGIDDIGIIRHEERYPGTAALEELLEAVLETGSADVDVVSGATFSSRGFLEALEDALGKAAP